MLLRFLFEPAAHEESNVKIKMILLQEIKVYSFKAVTQPSNKAVTHSAKNATDLMQVVDFTGQM